MEIYIHVLNHDNQDQIIASLTPDPTITCGRDVLLSFYRTGGKWKVSGSSCFSTVDEAKLLNRALTLALEKLEDL